MNGTKFLIVALTILVSSIGPLRSTWKRERTCGVFRVEHPAHSLCSILLSQDQGTMTVVYASARVAVLASVAWNR